MENPIDAVKSQIADVKAKISQAKNDIQECDAKIKEWQARKVYKLDTDEIVNFEACSDAVKRNEIKADIDSAKTKTLELLLNLQAETSLTN